MAISLKAAGTWVGLTADGTVAIPGSPAAGDRMYLFLGFKHINVGSIATPSGWTLLGTRYADGAVLGGVGSGSMTVMVWYRDWVSGDADPLFDVTLSGGTLSQAMLVIQLWQKGAGENWDAPSIVNGNMSGSPFTTSATTTVTVPDGSVVQCLVAVRDDSATFTRPTDGILDSGGLITWNGDYVESPATHISNTTGNDQSADMGHRFVTTGAAGVTLQTKGTNSAAETGAVAWVVQSVSSATSGSFTANAVVLRNQSASFTADADITVSALRPRFNITALGIWRSLRRAAPQRRPFYTVPPETGTFEFSFTADAVTLATQSGAFSADAVVAAAADVLRPKSNLTALGIWRPKVRHPRQRRKLKATSGADTISGSFTADAVIAFSFTANAVIKREQSSSFTADAIIKDVCGIYVVGSNFASANSVSLPPFKVGDIAFAQSYSSAGSTPANPAGWTSEYSGSGQRVSSRVLQSGDTTAGTFTNGTQTQVIVFRGVRGNIISAYYNAQTANNTTVTYNATLVAGGPLREHSWIIGLAGTKATNANAQNVTGMVTRSGGVAQLAIHTKEDTSTWATATFTDNTNGWTTATFAIDPERCFTVNAVIRDTRFFTVDAVIKAARSGSFTADAVVSGVYYSLTANAVIKAAQTGSFTADAVTRKGRTGSFKADAYLGSYQAHSFTADAWIHGTVAYAFTANAVIYNPALPSQTDPTGGSGSSGGSGGSNIVIRYDGTDITSNVMLRDAQFITKTNGSVGQAKLFVKDAAHSFGFVTGKDLTVDIDGFRAWGGYVVRAKKKFFFPAQDTTDDQEVVRGWEIEGVDYNVLFQKRIIFSSAHPTTKIAFQYGVDVYDDTIIKDIVANYLDLAGLGISTDGVERIDKPIFDIPGNNHRGSVASAGDMWATAMRSIARATGAVFYISPTKVLTYTDVDQTGPWTLTDQPADTWDVPYRELNINFNGTGLVNDMLVWGAASGSPRVVFKRVQDAPSIADHDRWQAGLFSQALYRQSSTDRIANSYVYGSPLNKRGGKDDQVSFNCVTFFPRFYAGMKIHCVSAIYDYDDVVPLRTAELTFPTKPSDPNTVIPMMTLSISHEIDEPWSTAEWLWKSFKIPDFNINIPVIDICLDCEGGLGGCDCSGITDTFTRTAGPVTSAPFPGTVGLLGNSDAGVPYRIEAYSGTLSASVDGDELAVSMTTSNSSSPNFAATLDGTWPMQYNVVKSIEFTLSALPTSGRWITVGGGMAGIGWYALILPTASSAFGFPLSTAITIPSGFWVAGTTYTVTQVDDGTNTTNAISDGSTTYSIAKGVPHTSPTIEDIGFSAVGEAPGVFSDQTLTVTFDNFDVPEVDACSENRFDNFNRTVVGGTTTNASWGMSDFGVPWDNTGSFFGVVNAASVDGSSGKIIWDSGSPEMFALTDVLSGKAVHIYMRFMVSGWTHGGSDGYASYAIELLNAGVTNVRTVYLTPGSDIGFPHPDGYIEDDANGIIDFDWVPGQWYQVHIYYDPALGELDTNVWLDGTDEPAGWMLGGAYGPGDDPIDGGFGFQCYNQSSGFGTATSYIDYIDFDYDGKPCPGCDGRESFDTFTRSVGSGWGTSDYGIAWSEGGTTGGSSSLVTGTAGRLEVNGASGSASQRMFDIPIFPAEYTIGPITMANWPAYSGYVPNLTVRVGQDTAGQVGLFQGVGLLEIENFGSAVPSTGHDFSSPFWLKIRLESTTLRAKTWLFNDSEPSTWDAVATGATETTAMLQVYLNGPTGSISAFSAEIEAISLGDCHQLAGGAGGGYVCESPTTTDNRHFQLAEALVSGSSQVFVEGERMVRPTQYTEDPAGGQIIFAATLTIPQADSVYVCYTANGVYVA